MACNLKKRIGDLITKDIADNANTDGCGPTKCTSGSDGLFVTCQDSDGNVHEYEVSVVEVGASSEGESGCNSEGCSHK